MGWEVQCALNGESGLNLLEKETFDIILMDINMPVIGGIEATQRYRAMERSLGHEKTKIITFTSSVIQKDIDAAIVAGCDSYLFNTIKKQKFISAIEQLLGIN